MDTANRGVVPERRVGSSVVLGAVGSAHAQHFIGGAVVEAVRERQDVVNLDLRAEQALQRQWLAGIDAAPVVHRQFLPQAQAQPVLA